ncbi:GNAT family N-acetyltransferase [Yoonia sp. BS5-3]|uniref:GNAT family N-acetyltransferase n=1 Tax=Yoonia phaeophyticola TaxID=3137369 RepID=A0ABZ2V9H6_9RHOB
MRNYNFRKLTREDLPLMARWVQSPHVRTWLPEADKQVALMKQDMDNPNIDMQVVSLSAHAFAYIHDHDATTFGMPQYADLPRGARVISTFVGDSSFMASGHSTGYIEARIRVLRLKFPLIAVAPNTTDTRTISIYNQAGFHKRRLASTRDGKLVQVMTHN